MRTCPLALVAVTLVAAQPIRVRVLDSQDRTVPNARIEARSPSSTVVLATGPDGTAEIPLAAPCDLAVQAPGFEPLRARLTEASPEAVSLRLRPAILRYSVDVVVRDDAQPGAPTGANVEIARTGARTVLDAVDRVVPSAFVTRRGAMGYGIATNGTGGISIRGIGESPNTAVLVVVDGRPDFQGLMGHPLPDFYSLSGAEAVTVVAGPASVLYGSNAMGGVVEVKNWEPSEGMTTRLTSSFGSYYTGQHNLTHGTRFDRGYYSLNAGVAHTSGDRRRSAFRSQDGTLTAGYDLSNVWKASIEGRYGHFYVEDPGPVTAPLPSSYASVGRGGFSVNLHNATARTWGYMRGLSSHGKHFITDGFRSTDRTSGFRLDQNVLLTPQLTLEFGTDVMNFGGRARNIASFTDFGRHEITSAAGFTRAQWIAAPRLRLNSGVRYESNTQFGSITAPEFGAAYDFAPGYTLSAQVAKGFRNPTIRELYLFPAPNPLLEPERVWNYQAALQARPLSSLTASLTAYYADLSNLIVVTGRFPNLQLLNAGSAVNRGVEAMLRWRAQRRVAIQAGYAALRSTNLAPYVPANKFNYSVEFDAGRAFVSFGGMLVGKRWADQQHTSELDRYLLGVLRLTVPVNRKWNVFATVDNLFNRRYEVVPGYPMPGANAAGGFTVSF
ncbi:MAG: TonB-dependent receptor [Rhodospirillales bacterium]